MLWSPSSNNNKKQANLTIVFPMKVNIATKFKCELIMSEYQPLITKPRYTKSYIYRVTGSFHRCKFCSTNPSEKIARHPTKWFTKSRPQTPLSFARRCTGHETRKLTSQSVKIDDNNSFLLIISVPVPLSLSLSLSLSLCHCLCPFPCI